MSTRAPRSDRTELGRSLFDEGLREFNAGRYFEAHDIWEEFWHELRGPDRLFMQGLIHLAIGSYHNAMGNAAGAESQWGKAKKKLGGYPRVYWGISTLEWISWIEQHDKGVAVASHPGQLPFDSKGFPDHLPMAPE